MTPLEALRPVHRFALILLALAASAALAAFALGAPAAPWLAAFGGATFPVALIALARPGTDGSTGMGRRSARSGCCWPAASAAALALPGGGPDVAGLPLATGLMIFVLVPVPLLGLGLLYALSFGRHGLREEDLERMRRLREARESRRSHAERIDVPTLGGRPLIVAATLLEVCLGLGIWALAAARGAARLLGGAPGAGVVVTGLATMAAAFSGFVFLGGPGLTYRMGLSSLFINLSIGFTPTLLAWTLAKRLRLLAEVREVYTIPDAVLARYGSRAASGASAVAILIGTVGYLGTQLLAMGT